MGVVVSVGVVVGAVVGTVVASVVGAVVCSGFVCAQPARRKTARRITISFFMSEMPPFCFYYRIAIYICQLVYL